MAIILDGTTGESLSGNLTFTGTGQRITGDMSNSTTSNRVAFQSSTTNGNTSVSAIPNGTSTSSNFVAFAGTDPGNASYVRIRTDGTTSYLESGINGTATQLPMTFYTNNTEQMRIATDGTITGTKGNLQLISGTAVASTSGTSITFTGIPSWAKRVTVMFNGVSTNGTSYYLVQLGTAGGIVTTGYTGECYNASGPSSTTSTAGFVAIQQGAAYAVAGQLVFSLIDTSNNWTGTGIITTPGFVADIVGGNISLGGALTQVKITTVNGTDTFDAGSINIMYE
jgi:hypothetical protein